MTGKHFDLSGFLSQSYSYPQALGEYSDFYTGTCTKQDHELPKLVGVKLLRAIIHKKAHADKFTERFKKRAEHWVTFDHINVARCYGFTLDWGPMPAIIMDYYSKGDIMQYIKAKHLPLKEKIKMIKDVAEGLCYLHTLEPPIVHGNMRAANIFVTETGRAVIADYELGFMIPARDYTGYMFEENIGWLAPELLLEDNPTCTTATDIFAFAMTIVEITSNDVPFGTKCKAVLLRLRGEDQRPDLPVEVLECTWLSGIIQSCWSNEPLDRPTAFEIVDTFVTNSV